MSLHQTDYINLSKTILNTVVQNPDVIFQNVTNETHKVQAITALGMLAMFLHSLDTARTANTQVVPTTVTQ